MAAAVAASTDAICVVEQPRLLLAAAAAAAAASVLLMRLQLQAWQQQLRRVEDPHLTKPVYQSEELGMCP